MIFIVSETVSGHKVAFSLDQIDVIKEWPDQKKMASVITSSGREWMLKETFDDLTKRIAKAGRGLVVQQDGEAK